MKLARLLGLAAVGALLVLSAPAERALAMSINSPGVAAAVQDNAQQTTEVRWHGWHGWHHRHHWHRHHWHHRWHRHHRW